MDTNLGVSPPCPHQDHPARFLLLESTLDAYEVEDIEPTDIWRYLPEITVGADRRDVT